MQLTERLRTAAGQSSNSFTLGERALFAAVLERGFIDAVNGQHGAMLWFKDSPDFRTICECLELNRIAIEEIRAEALAEFGRKNARKYSFVCKQK